MTIASEPAGKLGSEERTRFPGWPTPTIATENAYLGDEERTEFPGRACRLPEPRVRRLPCHQKRAGLGVWACTRSREDRAAVKLWKRRAPCKGAELEVFAAAVGDLVRAWSPVLPWGTMACCPPRGVSDPDPSAAEILAAAVATRLGIPFVAIQSRTGPKRWHGVQPSLKQAPFAAALPDPPPPGPTIPGNSAVRSATGSVALPAPGPSRLRNLMTTSASSSCGPTAPVWPADSGPAPSRSGRTENERPPRRATPSTFTAGINGKDDPVFIESARGLILPPVPSVYNHGVAAWRSIYHPMSRRPHGGRGRPGRGLSKPECHRDAPSLTTRTGRACHWGCAGMTAAVAVRRGRSVMLVRPPACPDRILTWQAHTQERYSDGTCLGRVYTNSRHVPTGANRLPPGWSVPAQSDCAGLNRPRREHRAPRRAHPLPPGGCAVI
jgi:hypothetical protein